MCRIDERVYVRADGHESVFQDTTRCERGRRHGKTCSDARVRRTEYADPTSSPIASSPLTPNYNTQARRPSLSSRPPTKDAPISSLKNEIHIEIGSKKGKGKSYVPTVSITTGKSKRSSAGSTSGSEASHTVRTGYPNISPPPLDSNYGGLRPRYTHQRNPSSDESFTGSSRVPSLYDSPSLATTTTATSSGNHPIIHNARHVPSPVNTTRGQTGSPASPYRTTEFKPSSTLDETPDRNASHYASEILGRDEDRQRRREENKRRQEAQDREYAASAMREENLKHVRFEADQAKAKKEQPAQKTFSTHERHRAEEKEHARRQKRKEEERAAEDAAAKDAAARRSKPTTAHTKARRASVQMTAAQAAEHRHLVAAEAYQMEQERQKAEAIEREEQRLQQQPAFAPRLPPSIHDRQQDPGYYDPRGERITQPAPVPPPIIRRPSQSNPTRPDLGRRNSTRDRDRQDRDRQDRQDRRQPPIAYYNNSSTANTAAPNLPAARDRRPSSSHGAGHNPFIPPAAPAVDPWDHRAMGQALPSHGQAPLPAARGPQVGHNFPQPQLASRRMNQVFFDDEDGVEGEGDGGRYVGRRR